MTNIIFLHENPGEYLGFNLKIRSEIVGLWSNVAKSVNDQDFPLKVDSFSLILFAFEEKTVENRKVTVMK